MLSSLINPSFGDDIGRDFASLYKGFILHHHVFAGPLGLIAKLKPQKYVVCHPRRDACNMNGSGCAQQWCSCKSIIPSGSK